MSTFDLIDHQIEAYCEAHTTPEDDLLYKLYRETNLKVLNPRMLSGQMQGLFLSFIAKMIQPKYILEIGTYTGYSALRLAEGLVDDGELHTIEIDIEMEDMIRKYWDQSPLNKKINLHLGDANKLIEQLDYTWDLVFIDADKEDYDHYYETVLPKVRKGGFLLVDNVLWNGKVIQDIVHNDKDTLAITAFNDKVQQDNRVRNLLLPFRDGIMMIEKL